VSEHRHPETGQPIGAPVDTTPAQLPGPVTIQGRYGRIEKLTPQHAVDLWQVLAGHDAVWTYMSASGPFNTGAEFAAFISARATAPDPYAYAVVDETGKAAGYFTLMEIRPAMRVIEVGHVVYSPALQRTTLGTEAQYLLATYATSGTATRSTSRRGVRRCVTASSTKARRANS
jgi:RimJ/RimL family protein N-acetyltransferase